MKLREIISIVEGDLARFIREELGLGGLTGT